MVVDMVDVDVVRFLSPPQREGVPLCQGSQHDVHVGQQGGGGGGGGQGDEPLRLKIF